MGSVSPTDDDIHTLTAGPLAVRIAADGELRVGWTEPDWLGPGRLIAPGRSDGVLIGVSPTSVTVQPGWVAGEVTAVADEPVVVLRLEAREAREGIATGDFATPAVASHIDPSATF